MDQFINHIKNFKEVVGVIGAVGSFVNFWVKPQAKYAVPLGIVCAVFIFTWAWIERKNARPSIKAVAVVGIVVSIVTGLFFCFIYGVLLLRSPTAMGSVVQQATEEFVLDKNRRGNKLSGVHSLKFARNSSFVEIGIAPAPADLAGVEKLDVTPQTDPTIAGKITELANKSSDLQTYYRFAEPASNSPLDLFTIATVKPSSGSSPIHIRVNHTYIDRDLLWEIRQWIFRNLSW